MTMMRTALTLLVAGALSLMPAAAFADRSLGTYQTTDRKMDYLLELCGKSQTELCVTLTAVRGSADIPRTRAFLDRYVVDHARPAGKNVWKGSMTVSSYTISGTLTLHPGKKFVLYGCVYMVVCQDFTLIPAR
jgi:hypothetical protein